MDRLGLSVRGFDNGAGLGLALFSEDVRLVRESVGLHLQSLAGVAAGLLRLIAERFGVLIQGLGLGAGLLSDLARARAGAP